MESYFAVGDRAQQKCLNISRELAAFSAVASLSLGVDRHQSLLVYFIMTALWRPCRIISRIIILRVALYHDEALIISGDVLWGFLVGDDGCLRHLFRNTLALA